MHYTRWWTKGSPHAYSKAIPNTHRTKGDYVYIDLRNKKGVVVGVTKIDLNRKDIVLQYRWCMDSRGYAIGRVDSQLVRLHKYLTRYKVVDHINRDKLDNTLINLRESGMVENLRNTNGRNKTSVYKGVSLAKNNKWAVYAKFPKNNKRFWGYYDKEVEAAIAYNKYAKLYGDKFNYLNTF